MSTGENIRNSLQVLYRTYENISKMMEQCKSIAEDNGYLLMTDKFLRWKSDSNSDGWLLNSFILLFQRSSDPECTSGNHWRNGPVYTMEICLGLKSDLEALPEVLLSKFEYRNIMGWSEGCSPAHHWAFHQPVHPERNKLFIMQQKGDFFASIPVNEKVSDTYWGLSQAIFSTVPLTDIKSSNLHDMIFGTFDKLAEIKSDLWIKQVSD